MKYVRKNQNFVCGSCKKSLDEGDIYYVIDRVGYCMECADSQEEAETIW
jgi:hypothetical protein